MRLFSRNQLDWTARFSEVAEALEALATDGAWLDGEVVVLDARGVSDFGRLQRFVKEGQPGDLTYIAFDLLFEGGEDLRPLPLVERKRRLEQLLRRSGQAVHGVVRYGDHIEGLGGDVFAEACLQGLEGVVSKRAGDTYAGRRTRSWVKSKCGRRQEFVVGGFTDPSGTRRGFGALLLGAYDGEGALRYAGRAGSGFDDATLTRLHARLRKLERRTPPFADPPRGAEARGVHWTSPRLVAEVAFTEWTGEGQLRHPVFKGLREDKAPEDVVREVRVRGRRGCPEREPAEDGAGRSAAAARRGAPPPARRTSRWSAASRSATPTASSSPTPASPSWTSPATTRRSPTSSCPYLERRPLTVIRCPGGIAAECFFQKNVTPSVPRSVAKVRVRGADEKTVVYPVVDTPEALWPWSRTAPWSSTCGARAWARSRRPTSSCSTWTPRRTCRGAACARRRARCATSSRTAGSRATCGPPGARACTWSCPSCRASPGHA